MMENVGYEHCSDGFRLPDFSALKRLSADSCWRWPLLEEDGQAEFEVSPQRRTPPGALLVPSGTVRVALACAQVWPSQEERQPSAEILPALVKALALADTGLLWALDAQAQAGTHPAASATYWLFSWEFGDQCPLLGRWEVEIQVA